MFFMEVKVMENKIFYKIKQIISAFVIIRIDFPLQ